MQRATTDEQLEQIWEMVVESGNAPVRTVDRYGDLFTIFDGWNQVEEIAQIVYSNFTVLTTENAPSWDHLPEDRRPDPMHHIEWAIGEFGFKDQFQTCSNCYVAIDTTDYQPDHVWLADLGELLCGDCLRKDSNMQDDYLTYSAARLEEDGDCIYTRMAHPAEHGFVCVNGASTEFCLTDYSDDHPNYHSALTYADTLELRRLAKAARLIDSSIQIVFHYTYTFSGSNVIWARFNPNENVEFAQYQNDSSKTGVWYTTEEDSNRAALGYALSRVFAKYGILYNDYISKKVRGEIK